MCFDYNPIFLPPYSCVNPTHVVSFSSYIDLVHVASSSCVGPIHLALSNYVDPIDVSSSTIVLNPKGEKKTIVDDVAELSIPPNPISKKQNYDHTRKFQDSWAINLPWVKMCFRSNGFYIMLSVIYVVKWKGKTSCLVLSGMHFAST